MPRQPQERDAVETPAPQLKDVAEQIVLDRCQPCWG